MLWIRVDLEHKTFEITVDKAVIWALIQILMLVGTNVGQRL